MQTRVLFICKRSGLFEWLNVKRPLFKAFLNPIHLFTALLIVLAVVSFPKGALAETYVSGPITDDTTWTLAGSPYIVTADINVYKYTWLPAILTIEPGVTVKFAPGAGLIVGYLGSNSLKGALDAQGTVEDPIVFTSISSSPAPGDWKGIYFTSRTQGDLSVLKHCIVEYGGQTNDANLKMHIASPTVENCTIRHSSGKGIYITGTYSPVIGGEAAGNNIVNNAGDGVLAEDSTPHLIDNILSNNGGYAASIPPSISVVRGNSGEGNTYNVIGLQGGDIIANVTWEPNPLPYCVQGDIQIGKSVHNPVLTIEPGVVVKFLPATGLKTGFFPSYYNNAYGALDAQGTPEAPIVFTSMSSSPAPGDWKGINFTYLTRSEWTVLKYCIVEYGGHTDDADLRMHRASPTIENCTIRHSSGKGIYVTGTSTPLIGGEAAGNLIVNNAGDGILSEDSTPQIIDNTLSGNGGYAASIPPSTPVVRGNSGEGNSYNAIGLQGGDIIANVTWGSNPLPYCVQGDIQIGKSVYNPVLTIEPGVVVKFLPATGLKTGFFPSYYNNAYGALDAQGTPEAPIVFTSMSSSPAPGDWKGINFTNLTKSEWTVLKNCIVEYGGHTNNANLWVHSASPTIEHCTIRQSSYAGIRYTGVIPDGNSVERCTIEENQAGIVTDVDNPPIVKYNRIQNNIGGGVINLKDPEAQINGDYITVAAAYNWWGDVSGPAPDGTGNPISGRVLVSPWIIDFDDWDRDNVYDPFELAVFGSLEAIDTPPDDDGDGMDDDWEYHHGLDHTVDDAFLDLDGDGYHNFVEFQYSYSPSDASDSPGFSALYEYDALGRVKKAYRFQNNSAPPPPLGFRFF